MNAPTETIPPTDTMNAALTATDISSPGPIDSVPDDQAMHKLHSPQHTAHVHDTRYENDPTPPTEPMIADLTSTEPPSLDPIDSVPTEPCPTDSSQHTAPVHDTSYANAPTALPPTDTMHAALTAIDVSSLGPIDSVSHKHAMPK